MTWTIARALRSDWKALRRRRLPDVSVAVVDSGIDATHRALRGRVVRAIRLVVGGRAPRPRETSPRRNNDAFDHGTAVAGIVAEIAPNARLIDVRVLDSSSKSTGAALLAGFAAAIESGAQVINMSLACVADYAGPLHDLCEKAYRANQIVVAARRNMPLTDDGFPAELSSCIGVDLADLPSPFDVQFLSPPIEFAARGQHVRVPAAGGGFTHMTGTSFATPAVSGLCALLRGAFPGIRLFEIKSLLKASARAPAHE